MKLDVCATIIYLLINSIYLIHFVKSNQSFYRKNVVFTWLIKKIQLNITLNINIKLNESCELDEPVVQEFYAVDDLQNEDCDLKKYDNLKDSCMIIKKV
jgi:hypothetical protein